MEHFTEPWSSCLHASPQHDCGPKRGKDSGDPIPPPQNRTKHPAKYRFGVIVGQKRRHTTRMVHNDETGTEMGGANHDKVPQTGGAIGPTTRMTYNHAQPGAGRRAADPPPSGPSRDSEQHQSDPQSGPTGRRAADPPPSGPSRGGGRHLGDPGSRGRRLAETGPHARSPHAALPALPALSGTPLPAAPLNAAGCHGYVLEGEGRGRSTRPFWGMFRYTTNRVTLFRCGAQLRGPGYSWKMGI